MIKMNVSPKRNRGIYVFVGCFCWCLMIYWAKKNRGLKKKTMPFKVPLFFFRHVFSTQEMRLRSSQKKNPRKGTEFKSSNSFSTSSRSQDILVQSLVFLGWVVCLGGFFLVKMSSLVKKQNTIFEKTMPKQKKQYGLVVWKRELLSLKHNDIFCSIMSIWVSTQK